ncbi:MAG: hypothetical protein HYV07_34015 [Deltaproteobacteria bacterium]|nr:hypothetical protein [Deltaproteobacteria bacterium]
MRFALSAIFLITACAEAEPTADSGTPQVDSSTVNDSGMLGALDTGPMSMPDGGLQPDTGGMCVNITLFEDTDEDGFGVQATTSNACLFPGENQAGFSRQAGDCKPGDPIAFPGSEGVCGDFVADDCANADAPCPTTQTASLDVPNWDCTGAPPSNVYAYARFASGQGHYQDGGCFIFFEGQRNEFYAKHTLVPSNQDASCFGRYGGCICPSSPSYDKRIMAYTLRGTVAACPETRIVDHGGVSSAEAFDQPTSNECRKYLYAMHSYFMIPASFVASTVEHLERRITSFPTVEIACAANPPNTNLRFASLLTAPIEKNPGFVKK